MSRICRPTLLACTHFQKTLELRCKSFSELGNTMCGAKAIRGHRLVCLRKNLQRKVFIGKSKMREPCGGKEPAFPFSTRTDARMSSGSPMRFKGGTLRSSVKGEGERQVTGKIVFQKGRLLTMYMHPAVADLQCSGHLDVIDGLRKSRGYRLMKKRQEMSCGSPAQRTISTSDQSER